MKYLGIDYGAKRVGLAMSDESGKLAFPYSVLVNTDNLIREITEIIKKEEIGLVVIGESTNFQGESNKIMKAVEEFSQKLRDEMNIKIILEPEFMTSVQAERTTGKNKMQDASAAAIILQSFLDKTNNGII